MQEATQEKPYIPLYMRTELIQELYKSKEFSYTSTDKIVRRLLKAFTIPRLRATVQEVLGNYLPYLQNKPKRHKPYSLLQPLQPPTRL
jgi:hypothetical protein